MPLDNWNTTINGRADAAVLGSIPAPFVFVVGETVPRAFLSTNAGSVGLLVSGRMHYTAIALQQGNPISGLAYASDAQGMVTPTNWWFALYTSAGVLCRQTADQTTGAWAANTVKQVLLTTPYTPTYTGSHFIAICTVAATCPSLVAQPQPAHITGITPATNLSRNTTGLTTTAPTPIGAATAQANVPYAYAYQTL